jgi:hypothetical protein
MCWFSSIVQTSQRKLAAKPVSPLDWTGDRAKRTQIALNLHRPRLNFDPCSIEPMSAAATECAYLILREGAKREVMFQ